MTKYQEARVAVLGDYVNAYAQYSAKLAKAEADFRDAMADAVLVLVTSKCESAWRSVRRAFLTPQATHTHRPESVIILGGEAVPQEMPR